MISELREKQHPSHKPRGPRQAVVPGPSRTSPWAVAPSFWAGGLLDKPKIHDTFMLYLTNMSGKQKGHSKEFNVKYFQKRK